MINVLLNGSITEDVLENLLALLVLDKPSVLLFSFTELGCLL